MIGRIAAGTVRPEWTLSAISWLVAGMLVQVLQSALGL